ESGYPQLSTQLRADRSHLRPRQLPGSARPAGQLRDLQRAPGPRALGATQQAGASTGATDVLHESPALIPRILSATHVTPPPWLLELGSTGAWLSSNAARMISQGKPVAHSFLRRMSGQSIYESAVMTA